VIHSDHGSQFTCWSFTERVRQASLAPSMGTVGDAYDNAVIESFWGRLQTELLNRQKWRTRIELSSALFEYLEILWMGMRTETSGTIIDNPRGNEPQPPRSHRHPGSSRAHPGTGRRWVPRGSGGRTGAWHSRCEHSAADQPHQSRDAKGGASESLSG
jgi:transposase InsO family protein